MSGYTGNGASMAFATSAFDMEITSINITGMGQKEKIDVSHLGTTNWKENIMTLLNENGTIELEGNFDPDSALWQTALETAIEVITVTFPIRVPGNTTNATFVVNGSMSEFEPGEHTNDDKVSFSATVELLAKGTITAESA